MKAVIAARPFRKTQHLALGAPRARGRAVLATLLLLGSAQVAAEGSRSLFPSGYAASRAPMDLRDAATSATVARDRQFLYVYAQAGEYILLGSSNRTAGQSDNITVYDPQFFGQRALETLPTQTSFTCNAGATATTYVPNPNFDAAGLPTGWSAYNLVGTATWARVGGSNQGGGGGGHAGITPPATVTDSILQGPALVVGAGTPRTLSFFRQHDLPAGNTDGLVLEVSVNGGPYQDALALSGASFTLNGYTGTIASGSGNPLSGRSAWSGDQLAYQQSTYQLPGTLATGSRVQFRWRFGTNNAGAGAFMRVDTVTVVNLTAPGAAAGPHFSGAATGRINSRAAELAGPRSADNAAGGAGTWTPCAYRAPTTGIYGVVFSAPSDGVPGTDFISDADASALNTPALDVTLAAWEVQVRADAASTTDINGRLFTYAWMGRTSTNGAVSHSLYYATTDGYRYQQTLKGIQPITYALFGSRAGFFNSDGVSPLYKDVRGDDLNVTTFFPAGTNITAQIPEAPAFFSNNSPTGPNASQVNTVLGALGIPTTPPVPQLTSASFAGSISGITGALGVGGTFTFTTVNTLTYQIVVSRDGVNFDPANPLNRVLTGVALTGTHNVVWNGRDNAGNNFPVGNGYQWRIDGRNGEIHLPLVDTEGFAQGGFRLEKLNGPDVGTAAARTVYYDDRGYITSNGTAVGTNNGHLCGAGNAQVEPSPNVSLSGTDSATTYRSYAPTGDSNTDCASGAGNAFGSAKVLDTWALQLTPVIPGELNIVPNATEPALRIVKTGAAGPIDVSNATSTTYTLTVTNTGNAATSGNIVINDVLRPGLSLTSFTGTNWNCTGPTNVVCTYTGPALAAGGGTTNVQLTVSIAQFTVDANNTGRVSGGGDDVCVAPPAVLSAANALVCTSTVTVGTVPVTLSYVKSAVTNSVLNVEFMTLAEAGTVGFRVLGAATVDGERARLAPLVLAKGSSLAPQGYRVDVPYAGQRQIWIEEVAYNGLGTVYGPYPVGTERGEKVAGDLIDWSPIRAAVRAHESNRLAEIRSRGAGTSLEAELRVAESGIARISHAELLGLGIDWTGQDPGRVELLRGTRSIPLRYSGPATIGTGSAFEFLGEAIEGSLYTRTQVYRLRLGDGARSMPAENTSPIGQSAVDVVRDWMVHAPNREYDLSARSSDPYSAFRLVRTSPETATRTEVFALDDLHVPARAPEPEGGVPTESDRIEVEIWSDFEMPHSVEFVLNGTNLGRLDFDGLAAQTFTADVPAGVLQRGSNSLRLELPNNGGELDSINLESIRVYYERALVANNNRLSFTLPASFGNGPISDQVFADSFGTDDVPSCLPAYGCVPFRVTGLTTPEIVVMRQRGDEVTRLANVRLSSGPGGLQAEFAATAFAADRFWIAPATGGVPVNATPAIPVSDPLTGGPATYLIISHGSLIPGLNTFVQARQLEGLTVRVVDVQDVYRYYGTGAVNPESIRLAIADAEQRLGTRYVLLVGGDTRDYFDLGGNGSLSFIPTLYRQVGPIVTFAPTDVPFADVDGNDTQDVAIGRWPVRSLTELGFVIQKTLDYPQADHENKLLLLSDRDEGNVEFDVQTRLVPINFGTQWQTTEIALETYPGGVGLARSAMVDAVNAGRALTVYMGHGAPLAWSMDGLVTSQLLNDGLFFNPTRPTIAWAVGCYGTYFTQPAYNSVSHGLLGRNASGAAAVFGASTLTEISSDIVWLNALSARIRGQRLGDSLRITQNVLVNAGEEYRDIWLGVSLLGDPTLMLNEAP